MLERIILTCIRFRFAMFTEGMPTDRGREKVLCLQAVVALQLKLLDGFLADLLLKKCMRSLLGSQRTFRFKAGRGRDKNGN